MPTLTREQAVNALLDLKGATPITLTARTDSRCKAKDKDKNPNPFPRPIMKRNRVNGMVNFHYDEGVLRRLHKEGKSPDDFRKGASWHEPVIINGKITPLCTSKNPENRKTYIRFLFLRRVGDPQYHDAEGNPLSREQVAPYLPAPSTYENQGLDAPLVFLTYDLDNVESLTLNGQTYEIADAAYAAASA